MSNFPAPESLATDEQLARLVQSQTADVAYAIERGYWMTATGAQISLARTQAEIDRRAAAREAGR